MTEIEIRARLRGALDALVAITIARERADLAARGMSEDDLDYMVAAKQPMFERWKDEKLAEVVRFLSEPDASSHALQ